MIRDKADLVTVGLVMAGLALVLVALFGWWAPADAVAYIVVGGMGLVPLLGGWRHLSLNGRGTAAHIEQTERANYALWLANQERERRLAGPTAKPALPPDYGPDWREAANRFVLWGAAHGFTIRALAADDAPGKCIAWDDWRSLVDLLITAGVLTGAGNRTRFVDGWHLARWEREWRTLPLPHPDRPAPEVSIPVFANPTPHTTPQQAQTAVGG